MRSERAWSDVAEVFRHRRAAPIYSWERWLLGIFLFLGLWSVGYFALWWFRMAHVNHAALFVLLSLATWYGVFRMIVGWYNAFHIEQPEPVAAPAGLTVAIFTTSRSCSTVNASLNFISRALRSRFGWATLMFR